MSDAERPQGQDGRQGGERRPSTWTNCKEFNATIGQLELCVKVSRSGDYAPKYNIMVGRKRQDGSVGMSIPIYARGRGKIEIARVGEALAKLVKEAEDWIHNELQHREDEIIDEKLKAEAKHTKKYEQPKGLGALGKMDVAKRAKMEPAAASAIAAPAIAPTVEKAAEAPPDPAETK